MNQPDPSQEQPMMRRLRSPASEPVFSTFPTVVNFPKEAQKPMGTAPEALLGRHIGPYQICQLLDRGGMGTVYLAIRDDREVSMNVAIKFIRNDLQDNRVYQRFLNERQILADLAHPGISRLIDAGTTEWGQPYLIMDYIDGLPIDTFCQRHQLALPDILRLFQKVCTIVAYAHSHLVIHRDLKPSNILVTDHGEPVLLDFGIAKILESTPSQALTCTGDFLMTPEYASPEQVIGATPTPQSDLYNLSVVLYELLTKQLPYSLGNRSLAHVSQAICHGTPLRPSLAMKNHVAVTPARGSTCAIRIADLDAVLLKALRKDPELRYGSVLELGEELVRLCHNRPVTAGTAKPRFSLTALASQKSRNVAMAVLLCCLVGLAGFLWRDSLVSPKPAPPPTTIPTHQTHAIGTESVKETPEYDLEAQIDLREQRDLARKQWADLAHDRAMLQLQMEDLQTAKQATQDHLNTALAEKELLETDLEGLRQESQIAKKVLAEIEETKDQTDGKLKLLADLMVDSDTQKPDNRNQWIEKILSTSPKGTLSEHVELFKLAGLVCLRGGNLEKAQIYFEECLYLLGQPAVGNPSESVVTTFYLAQTFDAQSRWATAEAYYLAALNLIENPCDGAVLRWQITLQTAGFYQRWNQPETAIHHFKDALELAENDWGTQNQRYAQTLETLAEFYFSLNLIDHAIKAQQLALRILQQIHAGEAAVSAGLNRLSHYCCGENSPETIIPRAGSLLEPDASSGSSLYVVDTLSQPRITLPRFQPSERATNPASGVRNIGTQPMRSQAVGRGSHSPRMSSHGQSHQPGRPRPSSTASNRGGGRRN